MKKEEIKSGNNKRAGRLFYARKNYDFFDLKKHRSLLAVLIICSITALVYASVIIDNSESEFNLGTYNNTFYNSSVGGGAVQLNFSYNNGTYTSHIFSTGSNVSLNNLSWEYQRIQCSGNMSYINKLNGYCIDQYEASMQSSNSTAMGNSTDVANRNAPGSMPAASKPFSVPWVGISANSARTACTNAGKHLCTSEEWLAAANINGIVYNLPTGAATATAIPSGASDSAACNTYEAADCDSQSMNSSYVIGVGGDACNTGNKTSCVSVEGVYDMVGNVWEWTNETVGYSKPCEPVGTAGYCYWNSTNFINTTNSATAVYGNDGVYFLANTVSGYAVLRGGRWEYGARAGPFCAGLGDAPTDTNNYIGFRCCSS
ncbi:MAG: SUMF1/EgtB/PvdO family nonheme iron enzyme [Nanoarchaeota archaeon]|nr:SUMF1/EgtB/PvdO family nonheme iron enzyme [Nanoarchaeota archaeon]